VTLGESEEGNTKVVVGIAIGDLNAALTTTALINRIATSANKGRLGLFIYMLLPQ
jgi:nucleoside phosphorylase